MSTETLAVVNTTNNNDDVGVVVKPQDADDSKKRRRSVVAENTPALDSKRHKSDLWSQIPKRALSLADSCESNPIVLVLSSEDGTISVTVKEAGTLSKTEKFLLALMEEIQELTIDDAWADVHAPRAAAIFYTRTDGSPFNEQQTKQLDEWLALCGEDNTDGSYSLADVTGWECMSEGHMLKLTRKTQCFVYAEQNFVSD